MPELTRGNTQWGEGAYAADTAATAATAAAYAAADAANDAAYAGICFPISHPATEKITLAECPYCGESLTELQDSPKRKPHRKELR